MDRNFERALKLVLKHEGGWADHPKDPGGATMKGVTIGTFRRYVKPNATKDDLRKISDAQVATVYRRHYWDAVLGAELPDGVDYAVFDYAVNSGPSRAVKHLQSVVGVKADGRVGPVTLAATRARMHAQVIHMLCDRRMAFLQGLKTWPTFKNGWTARVKDVRSHALSFASSPTPTPRPADAHPPVQPSIPIPGPEREPRPLLDAPEPEDKPVSHSKRFWTWLTTGGGTALVPFVDWRVQFLIVVVVVGFAIYAIATMPAVRRKLGLAK